MLVYSRKLTTAFTSWYTPDNVGLEPDMLALWTKFSIVGLLKLITLLLSSTFGSTTNPVIILALCGSKRLIYLNIVKS